MAEAQVVTSSDTESSDDEQEEKYTALTDFTLKKLATFKKAILGVKSQLESKIEGIQKKQDEIIKNQHNLETKLSQLTPIVRSTPINTPDSLTRSIPSTSVGNTSIGETPRTKRVKRSFTPPTTLDQLSDEWERQLQPIATDMVMRKCDKLTLPQLAFFSYWVGKKKELIANNATIMQLIKDGTDAEVWTKEWSPSPTINLFDYMMNRVKNEVKKIRKRSKEADKLQQKFESTDTCDQSGFEGLLDFMESPNE